MTTEANNSITIAWKDAVPPPDLIEKAEREVAALGLSKSKNLLFHKVCNDDGNPVVTVYGCKGLNHFGGHYDPNAKWVPDGDGEEPTATSIKCTPRVAIRIARS